MKKSALGAMCVLLYASIIYSEAYAERGGKFDFSLVLPYLSGEDIEFEGGARAEINSDPGFGFGFSFNTSDKLAWRGDFLFNSVSYNATRVLDDGEFTREIFGGNIDTSSILFGADYYFSARAFSPFVNANAGWLFLDPNIPSGAPQSACWWDPWYGYDCHDYQSTYTDTNFVYGIGAGLRFQVNRHNFVKIGYYTEYMDFAQSSSSADFDSIRFELGVSY